MFQKLDKKYGFVGYCLIISIKECVKILHIQSKFGKHSMVTAELPIVHFMHQYHQKDCKRIDVQVLNL